MLMGSIYLYNMGTSSFDLTHLKGYGRNPSKKLFAYGAMEFQEKKSFEIPRPLESRNVFLHVSNSDKQLGILFGQKFCTLELKDRKNNLLRNQIG